MGWIKYYQTHWVYEDNDLDASCSQEQEPCNRYCIWSALLL